MTALRASYDAVAACDLEALPVSGLLEFIDRSRASHLSAAHAVTPRLGPVAGRDHCQGAGRQVVEGRAGDPVAHDDHRPEALLRPTDYDPEPRPDDPAVDMPNDPCDEDEAFCPRVEATTETALVQPIRENDGTATAASAVHDANSADGPQPCVLWSSVEADEAPTERTRAEHG